MVDNHLTSATLSLQVRSNPRPAMTLLVPEKSDVLRTATLPWDFKNPMEDAEALTSIMYATMRMENGVGLAAPQIGKAYRMFVMGDEHEFKACFNPCIIAVSEETELSEEGCLSFPGLLLKVSRHSVITVEYQTHQGELVQEELSGLWSRCFQHELDHLDGICFDQRVSKLVLERAKNRRKKVLKGSVKDV